MLNELYNSVTSKPDKVFIVQNAEDFFTIMDSAEENKDDHNNTKMLLVDGDEDMPPLTLEEEENTDNEEEDEGANEDEDNDGNINFTGYMMRTMNIRVDVEKDNFLTQTSC